MGAIHFAGRPKRGSSAPAAQRSLYSATVAATVSGSRPIISASSSMLSAMHMSSSMTRETSPPLLRAVSSMMAQTTSGTIWLIQVPP